MDPFFKVSMLEHLMAKDATLIAKLLTIYELEFMPRMDYPYFDLVPFSGQKGE